MKKIVFEPKYRRKTKKLLVLLAIVPSIFAVAALSQPELIFAYTIISLPFFLMMWLTLHTRMEYIEFAEEITVQYLLKRKEIYAYSDVRQIDSRFVKMKKGWINLGTSDLLLLENRDKANRIFEALLETDIIKEDQLLSKEKIRAAHVKQMHDLVIATAVAIPLWLGWLIFGHMPQGEWRLIILAIIWIPIAITVYFVREKRFKSR